jgi:hypothetical protein
MPRFWHSAGPDRAGGQAAVGRIKTRSLLALNRRRSRKPPAVPFEIPGAVLALPVWLIDRFRIDDRTSRPRPLVARIDIVHVHEAQPVTSSCGTIPLAGQP